ncbi:glucokinase [Cryobacterium sp. MP_M5]|uniref:ROK family protein n=1 Tax=unclassified Cryobacterium TaxID=2649013 RepID=UPI0018C904AD|nr:MULTISPECIES: ROK family protein [unclassified Cryobacterium]MBG6057211.1 glucokinase [Cryobacterium sp. MP_M3]MEC5175410.1 glucokinase [Cryobacterium sp. MP_M5]
MQQLCIDLGGSAAKIGVVQSGAVISSRLLTVDDTFTLTTLEDALDSFIASLDTRARFTSVGIAVPGVVNRSRGALLSAHGKYAQIQNVNLTDWAAKRFGVPAFIENDARAALLGEIRYGVAMNQHDAVLMVLGTGIGTAACISDTLLRGARDHAGILGGHMTVAVDGPVCPCGNVGCAEALASTWALRRAWDAQPGEAETRPEDIERLVSAAQRGNSHANRVLDGFIAIWGATLVSLCHAYDPSVAIISGGVMKAKDLLLPRLTQYVREHLWSSSYRPPILVPDHPQLSVMRGLASLESLPPKERK